ncbi:MAG: ATP-binding cassette domain-containing protein [Clostridiales bacterium]|nr:ATP-binding cassette domain-containing protein [Clostridiales bacterium]
MLRGNNICKVYGKQNVLNNIDIKLNKGEIVALIGINGSGKTTLLDILALAQRSDSGNIYIDDELASDDNKDKMRKKIAYVPQDVALFEELSVKENLLCWSKLSKEETLKRIEELEPYFNLQEMYSKKITKLSGGMKRRINFAVALLGEYDYMILDEPLAGVDQENTDRMVGFLKNERDKGKGILITGHERLLITTYADRIINLD